MTTPNDIGHDIASATVRAAPPVAVGAFATIGGLTLQDWVLIATLVYLAAQLLYLLWKWHRDILRAREEEADEAANHTPHHRYPEDE